MAITRYGAGFIIPLILWARSGFLSGWPIFSPGRKFSAELPLCLSCLRAGYDCIWTHVLRRRAVGSDVWQVWRLEGKVGFIGVEFAAAVFPLEPALGMSRIHRCLASCARLGRARTPVPTLAESPGLSRELKFR